jgi:hypothetical protein
MASHRRGIAVGAASADGAGVEPPRSAPLVGELLRPLAEYELVAGGGW